MTTAAIERKSTVPEIEFVQPKTAEDLYRMADIGSDIVFSAIRHIRDHDFDAWQILSEAHGETVNAFVWISRVRWIGGGQ